MLLIARTGEAASYLKRAFAARAVKKTYLALVHGVPAPPEGVIDAPMRLLDTRTHIKMGVAEGSEATGVTRNPTWERRSAQPSRRREPALSRCISPGG